MNAINDRLNPVVEVGRHIPVGLNTVGPKTLKIVSVDQKLDKKVGYIQSN